MTIETTLSLSEDHHRFLQGLVENGTFESLSAAVAAAMEELMWAEEHRRRMIEASADIIRERAAAPREAYVDEEVVFGPAFERLGRDDD